MSRFDAFEIKMRAAGMGNAAISSFKRNFEALERDETGVISEDSISPIENLPNADEVEAKAVVSLKEIAIIKLNGGLGTGMGLQAPKTLLEVRDGTNFLDLLVKQVSSLRESRGEAVRLLLMNSFSTSEASLAHLRHYADQGFADADEVELMQNMVPKIHTETLCPAEWPKEPALEWCPPGHGDIFSALIGSGWLNRLLTDGAKYAFVSNSDNLGAVMDERLLAHFAQTGAPFMMEVTRRTAADRKGGHLAVRKKDDRLLLREIAQCPEADLEAFQDISRHQFFNTNSLWLNLEKLRDQLSENDGVLPLPMITNRKNLDPRDPDSPPVIQLEIAMGSAIECFEGSIAIEVPRSRFAPVKTTADLLALRSDAYVVNENGQVKLQASREGIPPDISLSGEYKMVDALNKLGVPSLLACHSLLVQGPIAFAEGVILEGDVKFKNDHLESKVICAGTYKNGEF